MQCLNKCGDMREVRYEGELLDVCVTCLGVWLDRAELAEVVTSRAGPWPAEVVSQIMPELGQQGIPEHEQHRHQRCPKCPARLVPVNYQGTSGVIINTCPNGHGVWLDRGELIRIQVYMASRHSAPSA